MFRIVATVATMLIPVCAFAAFAIFQISGPGLTVTFASFGATCTGSSIAADQAAGISFNSYAAAQGAIKINLQMPNGTCCNTAANGTNWFKGAQNLLVQGNGTTISGCGSDIYPQWAGSGIIQNNTTNSLFATVSSGTSCITLLTPAEASRGTVGQWVLIGDQDLQGDGYPPNLYTYEYLQINSLNVSTGVICFTSNLQYSYKSTFPIFDPANTWIGGPATIFFLDPTWNTQIEFSAIFFNVGTSQTYANGRVVKFTGGSWLGTSGVNCFAPTQAGLFQATNVSTTNCTIEVDKLVDLLVWSNVTVDDIAFVSSSGANTATFTNVTNTHQFQGTPRRFFGTGLSLTGFTIGAKGIGASDEFSCVSCTITDITSSTASGESSVQAGWAFTGGGVMTRINQVSVNTTAPATAGTNVLTFASVPTNMTIGIQVIDDTVNTAIPSGSHITVASFTATTVTLSSNIASPGVGNGDSIRFKGGACNWCVEGKNLIFQAGGTTDGQTVQISSVTSSGNYLSVQTTLAGGLPAFAAIQNIFLHPSPRFTCTGCTGSVDIVDLAQTPARTSLYSYSKRTYDGSNSGPWPNFSGVAAFGTFWGNVSQVNINVSKAYSGVLGTLGMNAFSQNNNITDSSITRQTWVPQVNTFITGTRAITLSGVAGTQTGDSSLPVPDATRTWLVGTDKPNLTNSISGESSSVWPSVTIEVITDQALNLPP